MFATDGEGGLWKFVDWHRRGVRLVEVRPNGEDIARRFATGDAALEHFRAAYGKRLGSGLP